MAVARTGRYCGDLVHSLRLAHVGKRSGDYVPVCGADEPGMFARCPWRFSVDARSRDEGVRRGGFSRDAARRGIPHCGAVAHFSDGSDVGVALRVGVGAAVVAARRGGSRAANFRLRVRSSFFCPYHGRRAPCERAICMAIYAERLGAFPGPGTDCGAQTARNSACLSAREFGGDGLPKPGVRRGASA